MMYIEFISLNLPEFDSNGVLSRLRIVDIADPMRGKIGMPVLMIWYLELPARDVPSQPFGFPKSEDGFTYGGYTPFI